MGAVEQQEVAALAVAEQPQQLLTIEPKQYVALVFEPFAKQYADAVNAVRTVAYDIKTTAGMTTATKHRASFRDIRVGTEKARKFRKAPILEIGRLLDSRAEEIEATLLPLETMFDEEIKAEEQRKEAVKAEAARAEVARQAKVQAAIDEIKATVFTVAGKTSSEIDAAHIALDFRQMHADEFGKKLDEAVRIRSETLLKLTEMKDAALAREEEVRLAAERAEAQRIEFERVAAEQRAEAERLAARDREIEAQAAAARAAQAALDRQAEEARAEANRKAEAARAEQDRVAAEARATEQRRLDQQAAEVRAQQAEIDRVQREAREAEEARAAAERAEAERIAREAREAEQARLDAEAAERRRIEEEEAAARRAAEEAAHVAEQKLRDAAPAMLLALQEIVAQVTDPANADHTLSAFARGQRIADAIAAIAEATV